MRSEIAAALAGGALLLAAALPAVASTAEHQLSGKVSQLDAKAKILAVKKDDSGTTATEVSFTLAPDAKIMAGAKARSLGDLRVGESVKVTYTDQGSTHQAKRIDVLQANTAKAAPAKSSSTKPRSNY